MVTGRLRVRVADDVIALLTDTEVGRSDSADVAVVSLLPAPETDDKMTD